VDSDDNQQNEGVSLTIAAGENFCQVQDYAKASLWNRFAADMVDSLVASALGFPYIVVDCN
jgi:hypothetical protein